jgi:hypothetical protein
MSEKLAFHEVSTKHRVLSAEHGCGKLRECQPCAGSAKQREQCVNLQ